MTRMELWDFSPNLGHHYVCRSLIKNKSSLFRDPVCWMVAYYLPEMKTVTISSCIATSQLLKIAYKDQEIMSEIDNTEEYGLIAIALIGFEILMGVLYGLHRMCKAMKENRRITEYVAKVQQDAILEQTRLQSFNAIGENTGNDSANAANVSTPPRDAAPSSRAVPNDGARGAEASNSDAVSHRTSIHMPTDSKKVRI